jgi:hypothetical protein
MADRRPNDALRVARQLITTHPQAAEAEAARTIVQRGQAHIASAAQAERRAHDDSVRADDARLAKALVGIRKRHDEVKGFTWYIDATVPTSHADDRRLYLWRPAEVFPRRRSAATASTLAGVATSRLGSGSTIRRPIASARPITSR